jgi:hypothetical protein
MNDPVRHARVLEYAVVKPSGGAVDAIVRVQDRLARSGLRSSATLAADLVTLVIDGPGTIATGCRRQELHHVERCLGKVAKILRGESGRSGEDRESAAFRFLVSWFASAPAPAEPAADLAELDLAALGIVESGRHVNDPWVHWRSSEEKAFAKEGSPAFRRALTELTASMPLGFGTVAERVWLQPSPSQSPARTVDVTSKRRGGSDGEPVRSPIGVFREMAADGLPEDPTRIAASDLALLGSPHPEARAMLGVKLADSTLMVRFGSTSRPARRRPRALLVLALAETIGMHRQPAGTVVPAIEPLRESFLHAIVECFRAFELTDVDFQVEIRREGPVAQGSVRLSELRDKNGRLRHEYRQPDRLLRWLDERSPWLLVDCPCRSRNVGSTDRRRDSDFDAEYLISIGTSASVRDARPWTGILIAEWTDERPGIVTLRATGLPGHAPEELAIHEPRPLAEAIARILGQRPVEAESGRKETGSKETVVFA